MMPIVMLMVALAVIKTLISGINLEVKFNAKLMKKTIFACVKV